LAIAAFLLSAASLWYSHKAYDLSVETSRSVMDVKIELLRDWTFAAKAEDQKPLGVGMTLSNNGKSVIGGILLRVYPLFCYESTNIDSRSGAHLKPCLPLHYYEVEADDIGPSASREYRLDIDTKELATLVLDRKDFSGKLAGLTVRPKIHYVDAVQGTVKTFCLTMQADDKGVLSKGSVLYPCPSSAFFDFDDTMQLYKELFDSKK
jgi:hypothetical protein